MCRARDRTLLNHCGRPAIRPLASDAVVSAAAPHGFNNARVNVDIQSVGCLRFFRCHRRPGIQEDLSRAAGADQTRRAGSADHRCRARRLVARQAARTRARRASKNTAHWMRMRSPNSPPRCEFVDGSYEDPATYARLKRALQRREAADPLPRDSAEHVRRRRARARERRLRRECARHRRKAVRPRPGLRAGAEPVRCTPCSPSPPYSASTIISARRRCRTCCTFASRTRFSSRSGIATTSIACRSRWPKISASRVAARSTKRSARSAT